MPRVARALTAVALLAHLACSTGSTDPVTPGTEGPDTTAPPPAPDTLAPIPRAFVGVAIRAMDGSGLVADRTVLVRGDSILGVGPSGEVEIPAEFEVVAGAGKVLIPGLADMHAHVGMSFVDDTDATLRLNLARGVTTLLSMGDFSGRASPVRDEIAAGLRPGPTIYVAHFARAGSLSPIEETRADTPAEGRALVRRAVSEGDDFIKVYSLLAPEVFEAIVDEARSAGIPVVGHGVRSVGMEAMLDAGVGMVAHAEEFLYAHATSSLDPADILSAVEIVTRNGAWVTATVSTYEGIRDLFDANRAGRDVGARLDATPGARYLPRARRNQWLTSHANNYGSTADISPQLGFQLRMMRDFERAGVSLLLGTDSPVIPGLVPGFALLREMALLRGAGIPAEAVLHAGTASAGDFIAATVGGRGFGRIAPGLRADLVLLDDDPVVRPEALDDPVGTMAAGRWYPRETLSAWLADLAGS